MLCKVFHKIQCSARSCKVFCKISFGQKNSEEEVFVYRTLRIPLFMPNSKCQIWDYFAKRSKPCLEKTE